MPQNESIVAVVAFTILLKHCITSQDFYMDQKLKAEILQRKKYIFDTETAETASVMFKKCWKYLSSIYSNGKNRFFNLKRCFLSKKISCAVFSDLRLAI